MKTFICAMCNNEFESKANHAKYCPDCRSKAQVNRNNKYTERLINGTAIAVGSTQTCPICGKSYTVTSGSQKCCKDCQHKMDNKRKIKSNQRYTENTYDALSIYVHKGNREVLKKYAAEHDMSLNKLITTALEEYFDKHGKP